MHSRRNGQEGYAPLPTSNDAVVSQLVRQDTVPWYSKPNLRLLYCFMAPACLGVELTSGFDGSMVTGLQAVPSWLDYFDHPRSASLGLMASMYSLGSVAAIPVAPFVVDKIGRRYPIWFASIVLIAGGILQGCASSFAMFIVARFILGFSNVICIVAASSLIGELSHPKERAVISCLFNTSYHLGAVIAAGVTLATFAMTSNWGWRIPSLVQAVPSLLPVIFVPFLPESPRWLVSQGRGNEAYAILVKYHGEGDENEFAKAEYSQIKETIEAELNIAHMNRNAPLSTPGMRKRVLIASSLGVFVVWSGIGVITHYLFPILDSIGIHDNRTKNIINLARTSWGLVVGVLSALVAPRYPRRMMYLTCSVATFVIFTAWTMASAEYSITHGKISAQIVLVLVFLFIPAYNLGFVALTYTYLVELFPFHVRTTGITIYLWASRCASFFNLFVNPIGMEAAGWKWFIVYCVWNAFQTVFIYLVFPETSGRTLEELTFLYEGDLDQEVCREAGVEPLRQHEETETYGTMDRRATYHERE